MKKTHFLVLIISMLILACNNSKRNNTNIISQKEIIKSKNNPNCCTLNDVEKLNKHLKDLETTLKADIAYNFNNSIVYYTEQDKKLLLKLTRNTYSVRTIQHKGGCVENVSFFLDYKEIFNTDDGKHLAEETYEILVAKNNNKYFSYETK